MQFDFLFWHLHIGLKRFCERLRAILSDKNAKVEIPDHVLSDIARSVLPDIIAFFSVKENKVAYEQWKQERDRQMNLKETKKV